MNVNFMFITRYIQQEWYCIEQHGAANARLLSLQVYRQLTEIIQSYIYCEGVIQQMVQDLIYGVTTYIAAAASNLSGVPIREFCMPVVCADRPTTGQAECTALKCPH
jgi:hypothetical protein